MDIVIHPTRLHGTLTAIPSKSQAHRLLICAAFSDRATTLSCPETNRDIEATADCLRSLGAKIVRTQTGYTISPVCNIPKQAVLPWRKWFHTAFSSPCCRCIRSRGNFSIGRASPLPTAFSLVGRDGADGMRANKTI